LAGLLITVHLALLRLALLAGLTLLLILLLTGLRLVLVLLLLVLLARLIVLVSHIILQAWCVPAHLENGVPRPSFREPFEFPTFHALLIFAQNGGVPGFAPAIFRSN
jgi:hypothetical protein